VSGPATSTTGTFTTAGGYGYSVEGFGGNLYNVHNHNRGSSVYCATLANQVCPGWPASAVYVSAAAGSALNTGPNIYTTSIEAGSFIVNGKLYWPAHQVVPVAGVYNEGVQCLDLTTDLSCGLTVLETSTKGPSAGLGGLMSGDGIAAADGNYYFFAPSGNVLCFNPAAGACGVTHISGGSASAPLNTGFATILTAGRYAYVTYFNATDTFISCFDTVSSSTCPGFPIDEGVRPLLAGYPGFLAPVLSSTGAVVGACDVRAGRCYSPMGLVIGNPYLGHMAFGDTSNASGFGTGVTIGSKFYAGDHTTGLVDCFDFSSWSGTGAVPSCAGYAGPANPLDYTVRQLANLPGCLAADGGGAQITIFNAQTGGACVAATSTTAMSAPFYCDGQPHSGSWTTLTVNGLTGSDYAKASVTISGSSGPVAGFTNLVLLPGQTTLDVSSIPMSGTTAGLTATVNLTGVTDPSAAGAATLALNRTGDVYSQLCYSTTVSPVACAGTTTVSDNANAVTTQSALTDGPAGNASGPASFAVTPPAAHCMLAITKRASTQIARPGDTVTYTVTVTDNGTLDYTAASPAIVTDSLSNVVADATYNNDAAAAAGTVSYTAPELTWSGPLAAGATETITYSVTVNSPDTGPHQLVNTVTATDPSNCPSGAGSPACTVTVAIPSLSLRAPTPAENPSALAATGTALTRQLLTAGALLVLGLGLLLTGRRRRKL
jgi:uncharacterized repeat protein (TIGR01451 family)